MRKKLFGFLASLLFLGLSALAQNPSDFSRIGGKFYAHGFNTWQGVVFSGFSATGAQTATIFQGGGVTLKDGTLIYPFSSTAPLLWDVGQANQENIATTSVSGCSTYTTTEPPSCSITATFANTHGRGAIVKSGSFGLQEAINYANSQGGGVVVVDAQWKLDGGTDAILTAAVPFQNVSIEDVRSGSPQYWYLAGNATNLAAPTTLVAATAGFGVNGANFTGGFYTGSNTYITCIAYVDVMGQEGPCSATFTIATSGSATTDQIGYTAPAASTGAVGYTIYITLNGGSYVSAYKVPLVSQPTAVGVYPASNGVCTLTTIETVTPACALTNATYGQTGVGAVVSALTLNTSPIEPQSGIVSSTTIYVPNPGGRTVYTYVPGSPIGPSGLVASSLAFTTAGSATSTVPTVLGTLNMPPGIMNYRGRVLEVCGKWNVASGDTSTIINIQFQWDAVGQNTAGKGVQIGTLGLTPATAVATASEGTFCEDFQTTVTGATATGGSIATMGGFINTAGVTTAAAGQGAGTDPTVGATASLNLAADARLNVIHLHTTSVAGITPVLQALTAKIIN